MPGSLVAYAEERSQLESSAPTAAAITEALRRVTFSPGAWLGPAPRVTRVARIGVGFLTRAAWVWQWTTAHTDDAVANVLQDWCRQELGAMPGAAWTNSVYRFTPALNGTLEWWSSGQAAVTHTRDEFPVLAGRLDAEENPVGPTTNATHPTTAGDAARAVANRVDDWIPWVAGAAIVLGGAYVLKGD